MGTGDWKLGQAQRIDVDILLYAGRIQRVRLKKLRKTAHELGFDLVELQKAA